MDLPGAGRPDDADQLAGLDAQVHAPQRLDRRIARVALHDAVEFRDGGHDGTTIVVADRRDRRPARVTSTQPSWKMPVVTPTRWVVPTASTTSTA